MSITTIILATIVALEHFYIFYLESIATQSDATSRVFNMEKEELARQSVSSLFKNQGIYNALLGVFFLYGIYFSQNLEIVIIFVLFVIGAAAYFSSLPIKAMVQAIKKEGLPASVSNTAGTFVCNHLMYQALYLVEKKFPHVKTGFMHIPYMMEQVVGA